MLLLSWQRLVNLNQYFENEKLHFGGVEARGGACRKGLESDFAVKVFSEGG